MTQIIDSKQYVYYDNGTGFTDFTMNLFSTDVTKTATFDISATKILYFGKEYTTNYRYFNFKTPKSAITLKVEYYKKGTGWTEVSNLWDNTFNFSQNGHLYFTLPSDWEKNTINSKELYWWKITNTATAVTGLILYTIKNLYSDDQMVSDYLPELLDRYLPTGKTDFLYLHELAKNEMINDLKAAQKIDYEDQIKDDSIIVMQQLSCYKFLELLLLPLIEDKSIEKMYDTFKAMYKSRKDEARLSVDTNKDQTISSGEKQRVNFATISRV